MTMMSYNAGPFTRVASEWGDRLWSFLNEPEIVYRMKEASDREEPAAGAIGQRLHEAFGDPIKEDRIKQFIGYLIRQVMEDNGYTHHSYGHKTPCNPVFKNASLYAKQK